MTALIAVLALALARIPAVAHVGPLTTALLLGLAWRAVRGGPDERHGGYGFSAKTLLRAGIILLGIRLNLDLVVHAGPRILLLDLTVVGVGLAGISWLGRRLGLDPTIACLIAVDSSICGASAAAAAAPAIRAREDEIALVIPMCSLIGTAAVLVYTFVQHNHPFSDARYGMMAGGTLHEVAQVMAAVGPVPSAAEMGTMTKLTRVVLLVPAVLGLGWWTARTGRRSASAVPVPVPKPWFVLGFVGVGIANTLAQRLLPENADALRVLDGRVLGVANFLMAMAMAGMGLQVDLEHVRANGLRSLAAALMGWALLAGLAACEIALLTRS